MKKVGIIVALFFCVLSLCLTNTHAEEVKRVVIDPGHGGRDGGASALGVEEAKLNLEISFRLKSVFEKNGYEVIMTREEDIDLCKDVFVKREDMNQRVNKIHKSKAMYCISIHQNTFSDSKYRGAQVFYSKTNRMNQILAGTIQNSIKGYLGNTERDIVVRDNIYLLNKVTIPIVIVECGFITNKEEVALLQNYEYQVKIAYAIYEGCLEFEKK